MAETITAPVAPIAPTAPEPKPTGGTALQAALPAIAAAGAAAGSATAKSMASELGSFGLTGAYKLVGNMTAMAIIAAGLIWVYRDQRTDQLYYRDQAAQQASQQNAALVGAIRDLQAESRANRQALEELAREVRNRK